MGYTNETTHYGIPLALGSDLTTPMDYNEAFEKVDRDLYANTQDVAQATGKVNDIEVALGETNDEVTTVKGRVTTLEGTVTTQGNAITQNASRIEEVEDDALDMICAVDEGTAQVASVAVQEGKYFRYNNVLYMATADIAIGDTIVPNTNCRATNVGTELESMQAGDLPTAGDTRFDITTGKLQYYNGSTWVDYEGGTTMLLDFDNAVNITSTYTTTTAGAIVATLLKSTDSQASGAVTVDGKNVLSALAGEQPAHDGIVYGIDSGSVIVLSNIWQYATIKFVPYK